MCERAFLQLHVGMQIDLGRLRRFVAEPKSNDAQIHTTMQQGHGSRVPQRVRRYLLRFQ
jgi:(p)ppGpp synthase/HD superfamily hydrolase